MHAYDTITVFANDAMRRHGLSPAARQALMVLDGHAGPMSPGAVAGLLLVTPASITSLFDTLERRGLVTRRPDPDDRRRVQVEVTEAGRVLVDQFVPEAVALSAAVMAGLGEAERAELMRLLGKVQEAPATLDGDAIVSRVRPRERNQGRRA
ncbi:MAG: MarR family winged helix-turn-helix transcriptional regulator [Chloroflexota bacterium]